MAEPLVLKSKLLTERGVRHGFGTRIGGVSEGPFATLNVAVGPGDEPAAVQENLRRFATALGVALERLYQTSQVHGAEVRVIEPHDERLAVLQEHADGLVAWDPSTAIGIRVADCVPVLLHDGAKNQVAALHAGWRGVVSGIVQNGVSHLARSALSSASIVAAIGPSIGPFCFAVGEGVARALLDAVPDESIVQRDRGPKPYVDLRLAVRLQLRALGVADAAIEDVPGCTKCDAERFFSHRRDGARSGRLLAAIAPRA
jgi:YfiH family protein